MGVLQGKKAIITGGSRGIGKAIAAAFLREGVEVMIATRSSEELSEAKKDLEKIAEGNEERSLCAAQGKIRHLST